MPKGVFLTVESTEGWFIDDDLAILYLEELGWTIDSIPWNRDNVDWSIYDLVVVRSTWDYQHKPDAFISVLEKIDQETRLINSLSTIKWNIDKNYLLDFKSKGILIVPTIKRNFLKEGDRELVFQELNSDEIIIKPTIGANADDTFWIKKNSLDQFDEALKVFKTKECFVQPFLNSIIEEGEYSLMYIHNEYSHTILKKPADEDFRVQEEHGGSVITVQKPETRMLEIGKQIINLIEDTLYARVDLARDDQGDFLLMELELIEPCLYFANNPESPKLFAEAINGYPVKRS